MAKCTNLQLLIDEPLDPTELNEKSFFKRLAEFCKALKAIPGPNAKQGSMTCAVVGPWGAGKTTVLKVIRHHYNPLAQKFDELVEEQKKKELRDKQDQDNYGVTVWFEPWRYEQETHLIIPLLVEFHAAIRDRLKDENKKNAALQTARKLIGRLARGLLRTGGKIVEKHTGLNPYQIGEEFLQQYSEQEGRWAHETYLSEVYRFRNDFRTMVEIGSEGGAGQGQKRPVAVFIDDLDRCAPDQVRRLLESIKLFLCEAGVHFFLALDEQQVLQAVAEPFRKQASLYPGQETDKIALTRAKRYLEKFFQYKLDIGEASAFLADEVNGLRSDLWKNVVDNLFGDDENKKKQVKNLFNSIDPVPRKIKSAARWLYFEHKPGNAAQDGSFPLRFSELVFSLNWESIWVSHLIQETREAREAFFLGCLELFTTLTMGENDPSSYVLKKEKKLETNIKALKALTDSIWGTDSGVSSTSAAEPLRDEDSPAAPQQGSPTKVLSMYPNFIGYLWKTSHKKLKALTDSIWGTDSGVSSTSTAEPLKNEDSPAASQQGSPTEVLSMYPDFIGYLWETSHKKKREEIRRLATVTTCGRVK